jgi:hypothetical protein
MKQFNFETMILAFGTGVLFLILGTFAPTYAQKEQQPQAKDRQEQQQQQQANDRRDERQQQQVKDHQEQQQQPAKNRQDQQQQQQVKDRQDERQQEQAKNKQEQEQNQQQQQAKVQQKQQQQQVGLLKQQENKSHQGQQEVKGQQEHQVKVQEQQQQAKGMQKQQPTQPSQKVQPVQQSEQRVVWQQHRASSWQTEHRTWLQRGGYNGYRIPEDHFHGYFGRDHGFRIYNRSLEIFDGHPRFQYEGYWFCVVDPWPEYWSAYWYENDDVYIDYIGGGYYMYNRRHPRDRIAITVYVG